MDPADALWIGGIPHEARAFVARAVAERHGLGVYSVPVRELPSTIDELSRVAVRRFRDVLEEVRGLAERSMVVEGIELFPTSVAAILRSPDRALFVLPGGSEPTPDPLHAALSRAIERDARDLRLRVIRAGGPLDELAASAVGQLPAPSPPTAGGGTSP